MWLPIHDLIKVDQMTEVFISMINSWWISGVSDEDKNIFVSNADIDGLVQNCSNSIADALELLQSCTKPSI